MTFLTGTIFAFGVVYAQGGAIATVEAGKEFTTSVMLSKAPTSPMTSLSFDYYYDAKLIEFVGVLGAPVVTVGTTSAGVPKILTNSVSGEQ